MSKIEHGPYGDAWAYRVTVDNSMRCLGWHRADNEQDALANAQADAEKFSLGKYQGDAEVLRVEVDAQCPKVGGLEHTDGEYIDDGVSIPFMGACPVQGEGVVDGFEAYYRARGAGWSLTITLSEHEEWTYGEAPYAWPDGGWLHCEESITNIAAAVEAFRQRGLPSRGSA